MKDLAMIVLNGAIQAGYLVLALIAVRLIFQKAPKKLLCALWALVGLRLAVPVSLSSVFSLLPARTPVTATGDIGGVYVQTGLPPVDHAANTLLQTAAAPGAPTREIAEQTAVDWSSVLAVVWLCGAALLLGYALVSFLRLRLQVREAVREPDGVWLCDRVDSPFILGVVRPRIYLPTDVAASDRPLILAHERAHLRRRDHLWKPLGFLLLAVYWFNPLLWVAYVLLCRDIELACDERVLAQQGSEIKKEYANALLRCSAPKHLIRACPVAFGETGVKGRIKSVLNYKKPAFWVVVLALVASAVVAVCFMTIPKERAPAVVTVLNTGSDSKAVTVQPESVSLDRQTLRLKVTYVNTGDQPIEANETVWMLREADGAYAPLEVRNNDWDTTLRFQLPAQEQQTYNYTPSAFCDCTTPGRYRFQAHYRFADEPDGSFPHVMWFDFKISASEEQTDLASLPDGMDDAIHEAILKDNEEGNWSGECATEGHVVYGCEQNGSTWKVYLYHGFERYGFINGYFTDVAGHWMCAVLTMEQIDDLPRYACKQIDYPRDGSENAPSIKRLFPKKLEHRALNPSQSDSDEVTRQCEAQAKAYLDSIGREAAVVPYQQLHLQLPNLTAEVSNKLSKELGRMEGLFELTLGTREQLENGVRYVYRTSYLEAQNELLFTKEYYDTQEVVESFLADTQTGAWLTDRNPLHSRMAQSPFFDAVVTEIRDGSVLMNLTADSGNLKKDTQVELFLKGTDWENMPVYEGAAYRVTYKDGSLMETYPLQLRDVLNIEGLDAVELYLDGKVTAIEGDWATVSPFRTDTQRPLYGDLVRVATKPEVKGSPIKLEVGKSYRIVFLLKDISGSNPAVINPAQTFYAYDDISSGGNVALVTPTGPGVDPATITTTKQEPTTQQRTTATPPTTKKSEPTTRTSEPFVPPTTTWTTEPAQEGKVTLRILRNMEETSETLVYSLNNGTKETIEFDYYDFQLSRRTATGWETVPRIDMVPDVVLTCNPGRSFRKSVRLGQQFGKQLSAGEYRLQVSYTFHDSGKYETAAARFTVTRIERTTARTPEEMAAINRFGDEVRQRFPHLILSTDTWLFSAYEHMNTYAKFKDAVVSDDSVEPRPGYTPKTVTLVTDKGTYIAQFGKDGNFLSDNQ